MKYSIYCCIFLFVLSLSGFAQSLTGIWENSERFIEYTETAEAAAQDEDAVTGTFTMVLKTYYRFVYEDMGTYPVRVQQLQADLPHVYTCAIRYPNYKRPAQTNVWVYNSSLFTSFYRKMPYTAEAKNSANAANRSNTATEGLNAENTEAVQAASIRQNSTAAIESPSPIAGFWIEQGLRNGILIYPQDTPDFFDAFFFSGTDYIKFRYWKGDFEYKEQQARFTAADGQQIAVPKMIRYMDTLYRCITDNGSKLKNYERGSFSIAQDGTAYRLTLSPEGGGPGSHAIGDTYPHHQYPQIKDIPLYCEEDGSVFAFGTPFLTRSALTNLQEEVNKHNSLKRKPPEPLLKADELDFYWERIKEIRKEN